MWDREVVVLHAPDGPASYPMEVHHRIRRDEPSDYAEVAATLGKCVDVVSIQHGAGIWGGPDGAHVLDFVHALDIPAVATLHDVPTRPRPGERAVLAELVRALSATVVMSSAAATTIAQVYGADPARISVVPHGVPDLPYVAPETLKPKVGLEGHPIILSFGLLGPDKGCEVVLDALPAVVARHPTVRYVILGASRSEGGEAGADPYRASLVERAARLRVAGHVQFIDRFVGRVELTRWLEAADVFVTPYPDLDRTVSGAVAYAMGAGRPVVSSPFPYAVEMLADGRGTVVAPDDPAALADTLDRLLADGELRESMGRRAHEHGRSMTWSIVGERYRAILDAVASPRTPPVHRAGRTADRSGERSTAGRSG